jgi:curli production assembly/transport component CsgE
MNNGTTYEQQNERIEQYNPLEQRIRNSADLEIDGLIVDETITKIGRDFYDLFHQYWEPPVQAKNFTILIKELPARGTGALIQISANDELLFEQHMMPRYDIIQEIAVYAVALTTEYLESNLLKQQLDADSRRAIEKY